MSQISAKAYASPASGPALDDTTASRSTQALLLIGIGLSFGVFWYAGRLLGIPAEARHGGSLLIQPSVGYTIRELIAAIILVGGITLLANAALSRRWQLAGLMVGVGGLAAWSGRGGPIREVFLYASSVRVFLALALESILLCGLVGVLWTRLWRDPVTLLAKPGKSKAADFNAVLTSLTAQFIAMAAMMLILAQTDAKKQAMFSVFLAGLIGTSIAESYFSTPHAGRWYWIGPMVVAVVGYLAAMVSNGAWDTGSRELGGTLSALAQALPLDYASVGMLGSLLGYWWMHRTPDPSV